MCSHVSHPTLLGGLRGGVGGRLVVLSTSLTEAAQLQKRTCSIIRQDVAILPVCNHYWSAVATVCSYSYSQVEIAASARSYQVSTRVASGNAQLKAASCTCEVPLPPSDPKSMGKRKPHQQIFEQEQAGCAAAAKERSYYAPYPDGDTRVS